MGQRNWVDVGHVVNSLNVFDFDDDAKTRHVAVYLQQAA